MPSFEKSFERALGAATRSRSNGKPGKPLIGYMGSSAEGRLMKPRGWPATGWIRVSQTEKETGHLPNDRAVGTVLENKGRFAGGVAIYPFPDPAKDQLWRGHEFSTREAAEEHVRQLLAKVPPRTARKKTAADRAFTRLLGKGYYIVDTWGDAFDQPTKASAISSARKLRDHGWVRVHYSPGPEEPASLGRFVFLIWTDEAGKRHETENEAEIKRHPFKPGEPETPAGGF